MATPIPSVPSVVELSPEEIKEPVPELLVVEPKIEELAEVKEPEPEPTVTTEPVPLETPVPLIQLADLQTVDRLVITRHLRVRGMVFLRGKKNRFFIRTPNHEVLYTVNEKNKVTHTKMVGHLCSHVPIMNYYSDSRWVSYMCYGLRPLQLRVYNRHATEVLRIDRPYAFTMRLLPCQLQKMIIYSPPGQRIGTIEQQWAAVRPVYTVNNIQGESLFWIQGPCVTASCFKDVQFQIQRPDGTPVGATCKRWEGLMHSLFVSPVTARCGVAFDRELTVEEKALLLAGTILMEYVYYDA